MYIPFIDGVAFLWDVDTGHPVQKYTGHSGSVNGLSFHPQDTLCSSVSGDSTAHIWKYAVLTGSLTRQRNSNSNPLDRFVNVRVEEEEEDRESVIFSVSFQVCD